MFEESQYKPLLTRDFFRRVVHKRAEVLKLYITTSLRYKEEYSSFVEVRTTCLDKLQCVEVGAASMWYRNATHSRLDHLCNRAMPLSHLWRYLNESTGPLGLSFEYLNPLLEYNNQESSYIDTSIDYYCFNCLSYFTERMNQRIHR